MRISAPIAGGSRHRSPSRRQKIVGWRSRRKRPEIRGGASPLTMADFTQQRVGRRPQTTEPATAAGPFRRHTRAARQQGFVSSGNAYGGLINQPLKAVAGYIRYLDVRVTASGGAAGAHNAVAAADAPYNAIQNILFKDAFGQPIIQGGGYEILKLVAMYGGQHGFWNTADPANLPSFSAVAVTGNFSFRSRLPLELFDGFCSIAGANATATPQLTLSLNTTGAVYTTVPDTPPTLEVSIQEAYYEVPLDDPALGPPDNGSSCQWQQQTIATGVPSASYSSLQLPPLGSFVIALIFVFRDSTGARTDSIIPTANAAIQWQVDGVPEFIEEVGTRQDLMFQQHGVTRPTGVMVYTFRDPEGPSDPVSSFDSGDAWLPTTSASLLELLATWGTNANAPGQVTVLSGRVYAKDGIPYTHNAD